MSKKLIILCPHCDSKIEVLPSNEELTEFSAAVLKAGKELKIEEPPQEPPPPEKKTNWLDDVLGSGAKNE